MTRNVAAGSRARRRALWESVSISLASLAVVSAGIAGLWFESRQSLTEDYRHHLIGLAQTAATLIDPVLHASIRRPEQQNGPEYRRAVAPLRRMRAALPEVHYIYTAVLDGNDVRFVLDAADPASSSNGTVSDQAQIWELYADAGPAMRAVLGSPGKAGVAVATDRLYVDQWGSFMSGLAPLLDAGGAQIGAVGVDVDARVYVQRLAAARMSALQGLIPAGVLICLLGAAFYRIRLNGLWAAQAALEAAEATARGELTFRTLFESSPVGIALHDRASGELLRINDAMVGPSGYTREELLGMSFHALAPAPPAVANAGERAQAATSRRFGPHETLFTRKDGSAYSVLHSGIELFGADGREVVWSMVHDISERKAMESELALAARSDKLTGLANRALFIERLQAAMARVRLGRQTGFAVLFLDFDRFKLINDTLGHDAGDELLRQISQRLRSALRACDSQGSEEQANIVSRFGGDEFLLLINDLKQPQAAVKIAERLLNALALPYDIRGRETHSSASIGIVTHDQCDSSAEDIVRKADVAMYEAKRAGRGCSVVFNEQMHTRLTRHVTIENALRRAIGTPELYLVYQPIVDLSTRAVVSAEALIRWRHPVLGPISPGEFIPIAEETGLILAIGRWVQDEACRTMAAWQAALPERAPATISVNMSRAELALGAALIDQVGDTLRRHDLPPARLQLEVTEREIMRQAEPAVAMMHRFQTLGVKLAMDDFGTGTSSLGCLRNYPFDTIKIDQSFLKDVSSSPDVLAVMHATVSLIENLGMTSLAEGVEEPEQVAILQALGCRYAQGYLFGRPAEADVFVERLYLPSEDALRNTTMC